MAHGCDRETHTYRQTDRQTHRPRYICNNRPHTYEFLSKRSFVVLREVFFERQNDAVSDDREQHHVLERRSHQQALLRIVYTVRFVRYETPFNVRSKADILVKQLNLLHELKNGRICGKFWDGMLNNDFIYCWVRGCKNFGNRSAVGEVGDKTIAAPFYSQILRSSTCNRCSITADMIN